MTSFAGLGGRSGLGIRPALLVIDMSLAFTDPSSPMACDLDDVIGAIQRLLTSARTNGRIPIVFTTVEYGDREQMIARALLEKMPAALVCKPGSRWTEIDDRLNRGEDVLITKVFPSAFFGTSLISYLTSSQCDSVVICGASTSGCVRATAVDAVSHGYRVIVPREAVGDRSESAHQQSLDDVDLKYGDVLGMDDVIAWLDSVGSSSD